MFFLTGGIRLINRPYLLRINNSLADAGNNALFCYFLSWGGLRNALLPLWYNYYTNFLYVPIITCVCNIYGL